MSLNSTDEGSSINRVSRIEEWEVLRSSAQAARAPLVALFVASWAKNVPAADAALRAEVEALSLCNSTSGDASTGGAGGHDAVVPLVARVDVSAEDELEELAGEVRGEGGARFDF
jgi:hypothetical protein